MAINPAGVGQVAPRFRGLVKLGASVGEGSRLGFRLFGRAQFDDLETQPVFGRGEHVRFEAGARYHRLAVLAGHLCACVIHPVWNVAHESGELLEGFPLAIAAGSG